jgi:hypothetical protein
MLSVTPDNTASYAINSSTAGSAAYSFTCSGNLRLLIIGIISVNQDPAWISCNGVGMAKLTTINGPGSTITIRSSLWAYTNPANGSNNITVAWTGTLSARLVFRSYYNVHPFRPYGTPQAYGGDIMNTTFTFADSVNQGYAFHIGGFNTAGTKTIGGGETTLLNGQDTYTSPSATVSEMCAEKATTGANAQVSLSSNLARGFSHVGVPIFPFPGGRTFQIVNNG